MRQWKSRINGTQLREVIKNGTPFEVLKTLQLELKFKIKRIKDEDEKYAFEDLFDLVDSDVALGEEGLQAYVTEEDWTLQELVDDRLTQFYDLCDQFDIWVTV